MPTHARTLIQAALLSVVFAVTFTSCAVFSDIQKAMGNLMRCKFKIDSVSGFSVMDIPLGGKRSLTVEDGLKLLPAFQNHSLPASFTLTIAAINPNDGSGSTTRSTATLDHLAWTLLIDSTETISGYLSNPVTIPGTGQQTAIPLHMSIDLYKYFGQRGYASLVNLALALGGAQHTTSRIQLRARPTIGTSLGPISYPGEILIIDKEFRSQ